MNVAWWPHTTAPQVASVRLRCLQIVRQLRDWGHEASVYRPGDRAPQTLVLSKRYDAETLRHALSLSREAGTKLVLDLCDNHFVHGDDDPGGRLARRAQDLRDAIAQVHLVTTASAALAEVVRTQCAGRLPPVCVVDDAAEPPQALRRAFSWENLRARAALLRLRHWQARHTDVPTARRFVWFGNHGSPGVDGGMSDLARLRPALEQSASATGPLGLTVISNSAERHAQLTRGWTVPTFYLPWHADTFSTALQAHGTALIPIALNPFTACKTANRVLTAFQHGLNVVADAIPSYAPFSGCAVLDDWTFGLNGYGTPAQQSRRQADLLAGTAIAAEQFSLAKIGAQWLDALARLGEAGAPLVHAAMPPHSPQDR